MSVHGFDSKNTVGKFLLVVWKLGRLGGRPKSVDEKKQKAALALKSDHTVTVSKKFVKSSASHATLIISTPDQ